ncbi:MAG: hypothetical protein IPI58_00935 [Alphaproteobacteria bacterium]|nr:MAG: hypothetical protein IPI58_00935 [Alphaproteobacteria bacterium]
MRQTHQRGIAIGPILYIVAILAVLVSAIAAGSGSFNSDTSAVKAKAQATAILGYAHEVKFAVDRVLGKGCTDTQISFENNVVSGYTNPNAPSDKSCHVFDVSGGGVVLQKPPEGANKILDGGGFWTTDYVPYIIGGYAAIPNIGTNSNELVLYLPISEQKLCAAINNILGISDINDTFALYGATYTVGYFIGYYTAFSYDHYAPGVMSACVHIYDNEISFPIKLGIHYFFYYVLKVN